MKPEANVAIDGNTYTIGHIDTFAQMDVAIALAPIFAALVGGDGLEKPEAQQGLAGFNISSIATALARMPKSDRDFVRDTCLKVVHVDQAGRQVPVMRNGRLMFDFITMPTAFRLISEVVMGDLGGFIPASPSSLPEPTAD